MPFTEQGPSLLFRPAVHQLELAEPLVTWSVSSLLGWVAEVLVWFENHLPVRVVKYDGESPQHLRSDAPCNIGGGENARSILGKLREGHGDYESSEPNGRHPSDAGAQLTPYGNHL